MLPVHLMTTQSLLECHLCMASDCVISMGEARAGGRYDGLMKAVWQHAGVTSSPPPAAVGLTLNADRLTLQASAPKAKAPSAIPYLSQASPRPPPSPPLTLLCSLHATWKPAKGGGRKTQLMFVPGVGKACWEGVTHAVVEVTHAVVEVWDTGWSCCPQACGSVDDSLTAKLRCIDSLLVQCA